MRATVLVLLSGLLLTSCFHPVIKAGRLGGELGYTDLEVSGRLLPVVARPQSLSHRRLKCYAALSRVMKRHLGKAGYPDFMRESIGLLAGREVEMFYPRERRVYRFVLGFTPGGAQESLAGPYPISADDLAYCVSFSGLR